MIKPVDECLVLLLDTNFVCNIVCFIGAAKGYKGEDHLVELDVLTKIVVAPRVEIIGVHLQH